jgi:dTDP-D-glucose 4,6-dehydratase
MQPLKKMEKTETKLIDGSFSKFKTRTVLMELINSKIAYHKVEKFSNEMRFGEDRDHSDKRIAELEQEKQNLLTWLDSIKEEDNLKINCVIFTEKSE